MRWQWQNRNAHMFICKNYFCAQARFSVGSKIINMKNCLVIHSIFNGDNIISLYVASNNIHHLFCIYFWFWTNRECSCGICFNMKETWILQFLGIYFQMIRIWCSTIVRSLKFLFVWDNFLALATKTKGNKTKIIIIDLNWLVQKQTILMEYFSFMKHKNTCFMTSK